MDATGGLRVFLEVVSAVEGAVCLAVAVVLALRWWRSRNPATGSALGLFAVVALVIASSWWAPTDTETTAAAVAQDVLISVLVTIPYLLVRFTWVLGGVSDRAHRLMAGLLALEVLATLAAPPLPQPGEPRGSWVGAYVVLVLAAWTVQSVVAAVGLWRAGEGQSAVVKHRMRSLSTGAVLLAVTLVVSGSAGDSSSSPTALQVGVALAGLVAILLFALAFLLPPALRLVWRQADLAALSSAERGLMVALSRDDVADTIVPVLGSVFGGGGAALLDADAVPVRTTGLDAADGGRLRSLLLAAPGDDVHEVRPGILTARLSGGWLVVQAGRLAPVFGDDEAVLLGRVATLVDLALQRVSLFEQERASRTSAEAANAELETLLYSVSHDLRSPLISVLGYLDVLRQEHAAELTGDGPHYLERMSVNAVYMQSLISDLLELSRIGRSDPDPERLDLKVLATQVAEGAALHRPSATVRVVGDLPVVRMSDVRARQLLTNLVDNALKHGGRDDLTVTLSASTGPAGDLQVRVADDGQGIPVEYRTRVLRVFERLDAPKSSPGTGMGLAICKRIVESLGGTISVGGPAPGSTSGTTVTISLPASVVERPVPAQRFVHLDVDTRTPVEEPA